MPDEPRSSAEEQQKISYPRCCSVFDIMDGTALQGLRAMIEVTSWRLDGLNGVSALVMNTGFDACVPRAVSRRLC